MIINILAAADFPPVMILLAVVLCCIVFVSLVLNQFKQSLLVGYFLCGLLIANSGVLDIIGINDVSAIHVLSEIGIVLLLFTIGIEFSISELKALRKFILVGGGVQVGLTLLVTLGVMLMFSYDWRVSLVIGFVIALSSTAVSIKTFQDIEIPESPPARVTLGIAIFQDLAAILFIVLIPAILGIDEDSGLIMALMKGLIFMLMVIFLSKYGIPQLIDKVAKIRSNELFTVTVIGMCVVVALGSSLMGLSPALGAFAAGLIVSESKHSHRVLSDVLPFKDLFLTVFFVSVGLILDVSVIMENFWFILLVTFLILLVKFLITGLATRLVGLKSNRWILSAFSLASAGEFSIVLLNKIFVFNVLPERLEQSLLACTAISMAVVPSLMKWGVKYTNTHKKQKSAEVCRAEEKLGMIQQIEQISEHYIICGYGPIGRNLHRCMIKANIPVIIVELNPKTVKKLLKEGVMALFGDISDEEIWKHVQLNNSMGVAMTFPLVDITEKACAHILKIKPDCVIHARCKFESSVERLEKAGVQHVMLDEEQSGRAMVRSVSHSFAFSVEEDWE